MAIFQGKWWKKTELFVDYVAKLNIPIYASHASFFVALAVFPSLVLVVGLLHTGVTYCLYFTALKDLPGQKAAILSYIDPLVAVVISVTLLKEPLTLWQGVGGALVLGFTLLNEIRLPEKKK